MLVIPAVDIKGGKCVRLYQGLPEKETVFSQDPVSVAVLWEQMGAEMLHLVDLDGAFTGIPKNKQVIKKIIKEVNIPVELGGGIRSLEVVKELLETGVSRVILGTVAITDPDLTREACRRYGERIAVGIDSKNGRVAVEGWKCTAAKDDLQLALEMRDCGVKRIIYTDTSRDGTLQGINVEKTGQIARLSGLKVIASGGVGSISDIENLKRIEALGVEGVILGRALYTGDVSFEEAMKAAGGGAMR